MDLLQWISVIIIFVWVGLIVWAILVTGGAKGP